MPHLRFLPRLATLCSAVLLAACGGSGGGAGAPTGGATPTTLSVSVSSLALSVNDTLTSPDLTGNPRIFEITNIGSVPAQSVIYAVSPSSPTWPVGTTHATDCATLAPGASCQITITPGGTPSAAPGVTSPVPITLSIGGTNTNILAPTVQVLAYGSQYQGGVVFALDDTTPNTGSVGGTVTAGTVVPATPWSPDSPDTAADSLTNGAANTSALLAHYGDAMIYPASALAARACDEFTDAGYTDWYLPAICEMGYDATGSGTGCGTAGAPAAQNVQSNLIDGNLVVGSPGTFWSSTESSVDSTFAWAHRFEQGNTFQVFDNKPMPYQLLCVRALTY